MSGRPGLAMNRLLGNPGRGYPALTTAGRFYGLLVLLVVAQLIIRGLLYPAAPSDDAEQLLFSQVLRWGYDVVNPPLYTWLVIALQQVFGVENVTVSLVKFAAYGMIFHFLYVLGRRAIDDERLAILAALSPLWLYYMAWDAVLSYSHTVLATALILAALAALLRLRENGNARSYLLFGLVLGFGLLSKYTFALAALAMLAGGLLYRPYRAVIVNPRMLIAVAVAGLIVAPHGYWLVQQSHMIGGAIAGKFEIGGAGDGFLATRLSGLKSAVVSGLSFISPLWLVLLTVFRKAFRERLKGRREMPPPARFLMIYLVTVIALLGLFVVLSGTTKIRAHYMFVLMPLPVVFFAWLRPSPERSRATQIYGATLLALTVLLVGGMVVKYITEPIRCQRCQLLLPYPEIARKIRDAGFRDGTIFAYYFPHDLAGNLRGAFPETRIVSTKFPTITRPPGNRPGQCLLVWMPKPGGVMDGNGMAQLANRELATKIPLGNLPIKSMEFEFDRTSGRMGKLNYMLFDPGRGMCR